MFPVALVWKCNWCREVRTIDNFPQVARKRGFGGTCKICRRKAEKKQREARRNIKLREELKQAPLRAIVTLCENDPEFLLACANIDSSLFRAQVQAERDKIVMKDKDARNKLAARPQCQEEFFRTHLERTGNKWTKLSK